MNTKLLLAGTLSLGLLSACDNGVSGDTYAEVVYEITPWGGVYDSVWVDVRKNSYRGPLRMTLKSSDTFMGSTLWDPDQYQHSLGLPKGDWVLVASYFRTLRDPKDTSKILGTAHRFAVAAASVSVGYDSDCQCNLLKGDHTDLSLRE